MGSNNSKKENSNEVISDTIGWNNVKTENMTASKKIFNDLSDDAKKLIVSLNIPDLTETPVSDHDVNNIFQKINNNLKGDDRDKFAKLMDELSPEDGNKEDMSTTSPFISSEMYDHMVNSKTSEDSIVNKQSGGGNRHLNHNNYTVNESSTSSTTDLSSSSSDSDSNLMEQSEADIRAEVKRESRQRSSRHRSSRSSKQRTHRSKRTIKSEDTQTGGESDMNLSYLSSSAHTDGAFSDSDKPSHKSKKASDTEAKSSHQEDSVADENKEMVSTSVSVNTSDINMVSEL